MKLIIEDLTGRFDQQTVKLENGFIAHLESAFRIGDCIRATYRFCVLHYGKAVYNYFDEWYFPINKDGYCELIPISYQTVQKINSKITSTPN